MTAIALPVPVPTRRSQIAGAIGILLVAGFWGLLIPFLNGQVEGSNPFKAGVPFDLGGATIVPADGWQLGSSGPGALTIMTKGAATVLVTAAGAAESTIDEKLALAAVPFANDTTAHWVVGEPEMFKTDNGTPAGRLVANSPTDAGATYVISDGVQSMQLAASLDQASWKDLEPEIDQMARSIVLTGLDASGMVAP
jgi:hypothetical protein